MFVPNRADHQLVHISVLLRLLVNLAQKIKSALCFSYFSPASMLFVNAVLSGHDTMLQGLQSLLCKKMPSHQQYLIYCVLLINMQVHWALLDGLGVQAETKLWVRSEGKNGPAVLKALTRLNLPCCLDCSSLGVLGSSAVSCLSAGLQDEVNAPLLCMHSLPVRGKSWRGGRERER